MAPPAGLVWDCITAWPEPCGHDMLVLTLVQVTETYK